MTDLDLSRDTLHTVLNELNHPVVLVDRHGLVLQANEATVRLLADAATTPGGGVPGTPRWCPFLHEADGSPVEPGLFDDVLRSGQRRELELQRFGRWWQIHLVPLRDARGQVTRLLLMAHDISLIKDRQRLELHHQRKMADVLMQEIHHRIKNHLQGVVGLLRMHAGSVQSAERVLQAAASQVLSIAAVHGLLSEHAGTMTFEDLVRQIAEAQGAQSIIPVAMTPAPGSLRLSQDEAIPLAVATAELLTNAAKHTPPAPDAGIRVTLAQHADQVELRIHNGPARLPPDFQLPGADAPPSGLVLIQTLLPRQRTRLGIRQDGTEVLTTLRVLRDPLPACTAAAGRANIAP